MGHSKILGDSNKFKDSMEIDRKWQHIAKIRTNWEMFLHDDWGKLFVDRGQKRHDQSIQIQGMRFKWGSVFVEFELWISF